jgi:hypothetical protein
MTKDDKRDPRIFYPDNRFERMARRSGGVSRDAALKQAQEQIDAYKDNFALWLDQQLQDLELATAELASDPSSGRAHARVERICSEIRDLGTTMGYELLTFAARSFCLVLDAFRDGAEHDKEILDCHLRAVLLASAPRYRDLRPDQVPEMIDGLQRIAALTRKNTTT